MESITENLDQKKKKIYGPFQWIGSIVGPPSPCLRGVMRFPKISSGKYEFNENLEMPGFFTVF